MVSLNPALHVPVRGYEKEKFGYEHNRPHENHLPIMQNRIRSCFPVEPFENYKQFFPFIVPKPVHHTLPWRIKVNWKLERSINSATSPTLRPLCK